MSKSLKAFLQKWSTFILKSKGRTSAIWSIAFVLTAGIAFVEVGYIFVQNQRINELMGANVLWRDRAQEMDKSSSNQRMFNSNIQSSTKPGWVRYQDEALGVSFEYPIDQIELRQLNSSGPTGTIRNISLLSKKTKDLDGRPIELLTFSDTYNPATYGDKNTPESIEPAKYMVQGKKYDVWNFVFGEGSQCGGANLRTETVRLKENLVIYKVTIDQQRNKDRENCVGDKYDEFSTPATDLLLADKIISTIEFKE